MAFSWNQDLVYTLQMTSEDSLELALTYFSSLTCFHLYSLSSSTHFQDLLALPITAM